MHLKVEEVHAEVTVFLLLPNVWAHLEPFAYMVEKKNFHLEFVRD